MYILRLIRKSPDRRCVGLGVVGMSKVYNVEPEVYNVINVLCGDVWNVVCDV